MDALTSGFQCKRVGGPVTVGRSSEGIGGVGGSLSLNLPNAPFFLLSAVAERLLAGRLGLVLFKLSVLPWTERGGVRVPGRNRSVGRRAAGTYMGDFGGRIWRLASGSWNALLGEVGERFAGDCEGSIGGGAYC